MIRSSKRLSHQSKEESSVAEDRRAKRLSNIKTRLESRKLKQELKELGRPFFLRKEYVGFYGTLLVTSIGIVVNTLISSHNIREQTRSQIAKDLIARLDSSDPGQRMNAGKMLGKLDFRGAFEQLNDAYNFSVVAERVAQALGRRRVTPFDRVGIIETIAQESPFRQAGVLERASFLRAAIEADPSPLVRNKAMRGLVRLQPHVGSEEHADLKLWRDREAGRAHPGAAPVVIDPLHRMIHVPSLRAVIGSDQDGGAIEVEVAEFWIDRRPITNSEWDAAMAGGKVTAPDIEVPAPNGSQNDTQRALSAWRVSHPDLPVIGMTQRQASQYCAVTQRALPTEAQWEVAAGGEAGWIFPWGMNPALTQSVLDAEDVHMAKVKQSQLMIDAPALSAGTDFDKSVFGVERLVTGVRQWTRTQWSTSTDQSNVECRDLCVVKGSAGREQYDLYKHDQLRFRITRRTRLAPDRGETNVGFRCIYEQLKP